VVRSSRLVHTHRLPATLLQSMVASPSGAGRPNMDPTIGEQLTLYRTDEDGNIITL
jgi:hypothetical protein